MLRFAILATASFIALTASAQDKQTAIKWGAVGGWDIRVDRSVGDGCFAHQAYDDGSHVRVGFDMKKNSIYFMITNLSWKSLEAGKLYSMQFVFDGQHKYNGELRGLKMGDYVWLDHSDISSDFTKDFMQRSNLRVFYRESRVASLSLANTYAAVAEVTNCQREIGGFKGGSQPAADPFNPGTKRSTDPFSR